ncbi:hypothetical protein ACLMJK_003911 [Lecanora helva]
MTSLPRLEAEDYTVAWLCALPKSELVAATGMLDTWHEALRLSNRHDRNTYTYGSINDHNVVIACLPPGQPGNLSALNLVQPLHQSFPNLCIHLFVGIGGGVPRSPPPDDPEEDIHLGDVVLGWAERTGDPGVVQWDYVRYHDAERVELLGSLDKPDRRLIGALGPILRDQISGRNLFHEHLSRLSSMSKFAHPGLEQDKLFESDYRHTANRFDCTECDEGSLLKRPSRLSPAPVLHQGTIASGNTVMQDAKQRDRISKRFYNAICFEMEAAGTMDETHCLVIRGISDYADTHKNSRWQHYAAATAAAFARQLLFTIQPFHVAEIASRDRTKRQQRADLLRWMSTIDYRNHHREKLKDLLSGSGQWLLKDQIFLDWQQSTKSAWLWLHGIPGCGKSSLMLPDRATVVNTLLSTNDASRLFRVAYFYCERSTAEPERAQPVEILRTLLKQLSISYSGQSIKAIVNEAFEKQKKEADLHGSSILKLTEEECTKLMIQLSTEESMIIIIDALDECEEDTRHELLEALDDVVNSSVKPVKVLVSSRDDVDLKLRLECQNNISISDESNSGDIERFVKSEVRRMINKGRLLDGKISKSIRKKVVSTLIRGAQGMFRWVTMSLAMLEGIKFQPTFLEVLGQLPPKLSLLYDEIMKQINALSTDEHEIATKTLKWLLCAQRLLSVQELVAAVSLVYPDSNESYSSSDESEKSYSSSDESEKSYSSSDESEKSYSSSDENEIDFQDQRPSPENDIIRLCRNLVVLDSEQGIFRFAHQSVREFLLKRPEFQEVEQHTLAAERCLDVYLTSEESASSSISETMEQNGLLRSYARVFWPVHYAFVDHLESGELRSKISQFLKDNEETSAIYVQWASEINCKGKLKFDFELNRKLGLDNSSRLGRKLLFAASRPVTHLAAVCAFGLISIMKTCRLSRRFVNQPRDDGYEKDSFLHIAASEGHEEILRILIENGVDVNARCRNCRTALQVAVKLGHYQIAKTLLDLGADMNAKDEDGDTALCLAIRHDETESLRLLLDLRADINTKDKYGDTPLMLAANCNKVECMRLLLDFGADMNAKNKHGHTALISAIRRDMTECVRLLLDFGADVNAKNKRGLTALKMAMWLNTMECVQLLLKFGADVNVKGGNGDTALKSAIQQEKVELVQLLLDSGADVNAKDRWGHTAFEIASDRGSDQVKQLLLSKGATSIG